MEVFLILGITFGGMICIVGLVFLIIRYNLNTRGRYQLYWTTQKGQLTLKVYKGQFIVKADSIQQAQKVGASKLQEKYQNKKWFTDIRFTVRGGGEKSVFLQEDWDLVEDVLRQ